MNALQPSIICESNIMEVQKDFKELLELFNGHKVEYMIVGAYALAYHGVPRFTGDIDIFVHSTFENAQKIISALTDFGFGFLGRKQYVDNKRAIGRKKDLADLESLGEE